MIAIDTNILVRYFADDDAAQSALARRFIEGELTIERPGLVTVVAVVELVWVLQRVYGQSAASVRQTLLKLLDAGQIVVEHADIVKSALTHSHDEVADILIHETARIRGCEKTVTFDRRFARVAGVQLLTAHDG